MATINVAGRQSVSATRARHDEPLQRVGGVAAIFQGVLGLGAFVLFQMVQPAMGLTDSTWDKPRIAVPFVVAHRGYFVFVGLFLIVSALLMPPIVLAVYDRLHLVSTGLIATATSFGAVGAVALLLNATGQYAEFHLFSSVSTSLGEGAEPYANIAYAATEGAAQIALGLWILLTSWGVLAHGGLPRWLAYPGLLIGIASFAILAGPPIGQLLGIPWFIALGVVLMRTPAATAPSE